MKKLFITIFLMFVILLLSTAIINNYTITKTNDLIAFKVIGDISFSEENLKKLKSINADCIMVLGAGLRQDGSPSHMLSDRLKVGIALYKEGVAPKLLLTGDHGQKHYDEVNAMKTFAIASGIPDNDIFLDHAGFSTYESIYRSSAVFKVQTMIIITQEYHQFRSLYIAEGFGIDAYGVASDQRIYSGHKSREIREILARNKDFLKMLYKPLPTYLGNEIPISGSGLATHD